MAGLFVQFFCHLQQSKLSLLPSTCHSAITQSSKLALTPQAHTDQDYYSHGLLSWHFTQAQTDQDYSELLLAQPLQLALLTSPD